MRKLFGILKKDEHGCLFHDGRRRADYVLVISEKTPVFINYIESLTELGLEIEECKRLEIGKSFLLIHIPKRELENYSKIYDIGLEIPMTNRERKRKFLRWLETNLEVPIKRRGTFTSKERIMIIHKLLESARFGEEKEEKGLAKLLKQRAIEDAYPLHDGSAVISSDPQKTNDRRLLYFYWARLGCWYKEVPLDLVYKYFGCEIAFYFAWVEFFNLMLLPAAIVGLLVFTVNFVIFKTRINNNQVDDICEADRMYICPPCNLPRYCQYRTASQYCSMAKGSYLFDNYSTVVFAIFMSFWATIFLNLWKRRQSYLTVRWSVHYVDSDETEIRHEYIDELKKRNVTRRAGEPEPFLPKYITGPRVVATVCVCIFMILLILISVTAVIVYNIIIQAEAGTGSVPFLKRNSKAVSTVTGSILQVVFVKLFGKMYARVSIALTNYENPRTKRDFDNSVLYKRYILAFMNNYASLFYIAFLKGRFYRLPYRTDLLRFLQTDTCQPTTCVVVLCTQLAFLMLLKKFVGNILSVMIINIKTICRRIRKTHEKDLTIYEADYALLPTNRYLLTTEFCEMIIVFGFVTFFVAAFPLAPLCALLNSIIEHRLDAFKLVTQYRRPIPRKISGIGAWNGVLLGVTYLSTATNAFVVAFTSDTVWRKLYLSKYGSDLKGYVNSTLSAFATKDYALFKNIPPKPEVCYYKDKRYPPDHPQKYEVTTDYWVDIAWRLICVFIFEHVILVINGVLSYIIPDLPKTVKERMNLDRHLAKQAKLKILNEGMYVERTETKNKKIDTSDWIML